MPQSENEIHRSRSSKNSSRQSESRTKRHRSLKSTCESDRPEMSGEASSSEELEYAILMDLVLTTMNERRFTQEEVRALNKNPGRWSIDQFFWMIWLAMDRCMEYAMIHHQEDLVSLSDQTTEHLTILMESGNTKFGRARERDEQLAAATNTVHQEVAQEGHVQRMEDMELAAVIRTQALSLATLEERVTRLEEQKVALSSEIE